jgi:hypothetical protein
VHNAAKAARIQGVWREVSVYFSELIVTAEETGCRERTVM